MVAISSGERGANVTTNQDKIVKFRDCVNGGAGCTKRPQEPTAFP